MITVTAVEDFTIFGDVEELLWWPVNRVIKGTLKPLQNPNKTGLHSSHFVQLKVSLVHQQFHILSECHQSPIRLSSSGECWHLMAVVLRGLHPPLRRLW
jgi:hypothetical protein